MERQKKKDTDMTEGVIWKQLLWFALPLMVGNVFQQFYNTVDSIVVGNFVGKEALAAWQLAPVLSSPRAMGRKMMERSVLQSIPPFA